MYNLSIVAMFKNESSIIKQWIKHYIDEKVDHFYLIDNGSNDNYYDEIKEYNDKITIIKDNFRKKIGTQNFLINKHYLDKIKKETDWVIVCDIDEYIFDINYDSDIITYIRNLENKYKNLAKIMLPWKNFAAHKNKNIIPNDIPISLFARTNIINSNPLYGKSIVKTKYLVKLETHNSEIVKNNAYTAKLNLIDDLHLNHYQLISEKYYKTVKIVRGGGQSGFSSKYTMDFYNKEQGRCLKVEDHLLRNKKLNIKKLSIKNEVLKMKY